MGSFDDGGEVETLLENVVGAFGGWNGMEIGAGGSDFDAESGKRIERLEDEIVEVGRKIGELIEKPGSRDGGMLEIGDGIFADAEIPVGVSGPLDV